MSQAAITSWIGDTSIMEGFSEYIRVQLFFVVRAKDNLQFHRMYSNKVNKSKGILLDQIGKLTGYYVSKKYPEKLRYIKFYDEETDNELEFLSNNFDLKAKEIAQLYKYR